ncbi:MAG: protein kinase domain-containing protein [Nannocystaceae bacterium]|nr:serine/threonine protein kinase [bacterium]
MDEPRPRSVETQLRRRNIASRLFSEDAAVKVGRFTILERLGMGAMGAVYRAYDPSLDRAVALKVLHPDVMAAAAEAETTMRREAKVLARLSHPNVVTVHEVGGEASTIWIAMELVDGCTLGEHVRSLSEEQRFAGVIDAMLQAGEGLRAAHAAGIVHRDFKPANVMVGSDGRVRVTDFGLASLPRDATNASVGVGTPAYMPAEQFEGDVDARADQYAYCVVFWEVLFDARPSRSEPELRPPEGSIPEAAALVAVLRRGLRDDPADRYASMDALLEATRDVVFEKPRQRRQRRRVVGSIVGLFASAGVAAWVTAGSTEDPCSGAHERLAGYASDDVLDRLATLATGQAYAQRAVPRLRDAFEDFGQDWVGAYEATCLAHVRKETSDYVFERRMSCLEQAGAAYAALGERASLDAPDLSGLVSAAAGLPGPKRCTILTAERELSRPPPEIQSEVDAIDSLLARVRTLVEAGAPLRALELANEAVERADTVAWDPVKARALHERGRISTISGPLPDLSTEQSKHDLRTAWELALLQRRFPLAVEAWSRWAWLSGTDVPDAGPLLEQSPLIDALVRGVAPGSAEEALFHNNVGGLHLAGSELERARVSFRRAVDIATGLKRPPAELYNASVNLALVTQDNDTRDAVFHDVQREQRARLGDEHPQVLHLELLFAVTTASPRTRAQVLETLVATYEEFHPEMILPRVEAHLELAWSKLRDGNGPEAAANFSASADLDDRDLSADVARGYADLARGDPAAARLRFEAVESGTADSQWQRYNAAHALLGLAVIDQSAERFRAAASMFGGLASLPTAALVTRLEFAADALPSAPGVESLAQTLRRWRSGAASRADIAASLELVATAPD